MSSPGEEDLAAEFAKSEPDSDIVRQICAEHGVPPALRGQVWQVLLGVMNKKANLEAWAEDQGEMEDRQVIRADVQRTRQTIPKFKTEQVQKDLEQLLVIYCKRRSVKYTQGLNELIAPFFELELDTGAIFNCFYALVQKFLPNTLRGHDLKTLRRSLELFRVLLRYHRPTLANALESAEVHPDFYATSWFVTLLASDNDLQVVLALWDQIIVRDDPLLIFFIALALLSRSSHAVLAASAEDAASLLRAIRVSKVGDVEGLVRAAKDFMAATPKSFRRTLHRATMTDEANVQLDAVLKEVPVVVVTAAEVGAERGLRFQVVDCRPEKDFNRGRLPTAINLDVEALRDGGGLAAALEAMRAWLGAGQHLCLLGVSGTLSPPVQAVLAFLLQHAVERVSVLEGGFAACQSLHEQGACELVHESPSPAAQDNTKLYPDPIDMFSAKSQEALEQAKKIKEDASKAAREAITALQQSERVAQAAEKTKQKAKAWSKQGFGLLSSAWGKATTVATNVASDLSRELTTGTSAGGANAEGEGAGEARFAIDDDEDSMNQRRQSAAASDSGGGGGRGRGGGKAEDEEEGGSEFQLDSLINVAHWASRPLTSVTTCQRLGPNGATFARYLVVSQSHVMDLEAVKNKANVAKLKAWHPLGHMTELKVNEKDRALTLIFKAAPTAKPKGYVYILDQAKLAGTVESIRDLQKRQKGAIYGGASSRWTVAELTGGEGAVGGGKDTGAKAAAGGGAGTKGEEKKAEGEGAVPGGGGSGKGGGGGTDGGEGIGAQPDRGLAEVGGGSLIDFGGDPSAESKTGDVLADVGGGGEVKQGEKGEEGGGGAVLLEGGVGKGDEEKEMARKVEEEKAKKREEEEEGKERETRDKEERDKKEREEREERDKEERDKKEREEREEAEKRKAQEQKEDEKKREEERKEEAEERKGKEEEEEKKREERKGREAEEQKKEEAPVLVETKTATASKDEEDADWLGDDMGDLAVSGTTGASSGGGGAGGAGGGGGSEEDEELDWLNDVEVNEEAGAGGDDDDVPDWLKD